MYPLSTGSGTGRSAPTRRIHDVAAKSTHARKGLTCERGSSRVRPRLLRSLKWEFCCCAGCKVTQVAPRKGAATGEFHFRRSAETCQESGEFYGESVLRRRPECVNRSHGLQFLKIIGPGLNDPILEQVWLKGVLISQDP